MTLYLIGLGVGLIIMAPLIILALYAGISVRRSDGAEPSLAPVRNVAREFRPQLRIVEGSAAR